MNFELSCHGVKWFAFCLSTAARLHLFACTDFLTGIIAGENKKTITGCWWNRHLCRRCTLSSYECMHNQAEMHIELIWMYAQPSPQACVRFLVKLGSSTLLCAIHMLQRKITLLGTCDLLFCTFVLSCKTWSEQAEQAWGWQEHLPCCGWGCWLGRSTGLVRVWAP